MILGLDHASDRFHLVCPRLCLEWHLRLSSKLSADQRRGLLCDALHAAFDEACLSDPQYGSDEDYYIHLFAEEPLALQNGKTTRVLGLAAGAMWREHRDFDIAWFWIEMAKWQSWCGIKQNLKTPERKQRAREYAIERGAPEDWEEDHYDAFDIALYGEHLLVQEALGVG